MNTVRSNAVAWFAVAGSCALLLATAAARAQTLREAVDKAWERQPAAQAQGSRAAELAARAKAAEGWVPSPPKVVLSERSDRFNRNQGGREYEAELGIPLWLPGQRARESELVKAEQALQRDALEHAKWKLAGEVREAFLLAKAAEVELAAALRRVDEAAALLADVRRRHQAGDLARTDLNQSLSSDIAARAAAAEARLRLTQATQAFFVLAGVTALPPADEAPLPAPPLLEHPALRQLRSVADAADARLRLAARAQRDNPELTLSYRRDRSARDDRYVGTTLLALSIPLATGARNEPRMAAANAEFIEARTAFDLERGRIEAEIAAAQRALQQAGAALELAQERQRLALENDRLLGKAFGLGEIDLATRLRAAAERYAADADVARAQREVQRAVSQLNHAYGALP